MKNHLLTKSNFRLFLFTLLLQLSNPMLHAAEQSTWKAVFTAGIAMLAGRMAWQRTNKNQTPVDTLDQCSHQNAGQFAYTHGVPQQVVDTAAFTSPHEPLPLRQSRGGYMRRIRNAALSAFAISAMRGMGAVAEFTSFVKTWDGDYEGAGYSVLQTINGNLFISGTLQVTFLHGLHSTAQVICLLEPPVMMM